MHYQVGVRDLPMDLFNTAHRKDFTVRLAGELVSTVACSNSNCQSVDAGLFHESLGFFWVCQKLIMAQNTFGTVSVFGLSMTRLQGSEAAELPFNAHTTGVCELDDTTGNLDVVFVRRWGLAIFFQRTIHHHGCESVFDRRQTGLGRVAVILVHHNRDVWIKLHSREHEVSQICILRIGPRTARCLNDHRRIGLLGRFHNRLDLFHVVDVKCGNSIVVFCSVI